MRDAPDDLKALLREVEILGFIMADIDADLSRKSLSLDSIDSQHASQSLRFSKEAVEDLKALYKDFPSRRLIQPSYQATKLVIRQQISCRRNLVVYNEYQRFSQPARPHYHAGWQAIWESWNSLVFNFLQVSVDVHQIINGELYLSHFWKGIWLLRYLSQSLTKFHDLTKKSSTWVFGPG
jgi:hypothetical protein